MKIRLTKKRIILLSVAVLTLFTIILLCFFFKDRKKNSESNEIPFFKVNPAWADTTLKYMSVDEKIGQLIFYRPETITKTNYDSVLVNLGKVLPGAIEYTTDSLSSFIRVQNNLQKISKTNVLTFLYRNESSLNFKDVYDFPNLLHIQSISDDSVMNRFFYTWIRLNKILNISGSLMLSGTHEADCKKCDTAYLNRLKLFINHAQNNTIHAFLADRELFPQDSAHFQQNCAFLNSGISGVVFKNTSDKKNNAFGLIPHLRTKYKFPGLMIADPESYNKDSVIRLFDSGFEMFKTDHPVQLKELILDLYNSNQIKPEQIDASVRKILLAKTWSGLNKKIVINDSLTREFLSSPVHIKNVECIFKNSVTLLKNDKNLIPIKSMTNKSITLIAIGSNEPKKLVVELSAFLPVKYRFLNSNDKQTLNNLSDYKKTGDLIVALINTPLDTNLTNAIKSNNNSISNTLINFGNCGNLKNAQIFNAIFQLYGNSDSDMKNAADAYFGAINVKGILPITIDPTFKRGQALIINKVRVTDCIPEEVGLDSKILSKIDSIVQTAIQNGAFPGCQIVVLKNGYSVYDKAFGYQTYSRDRAVLISDLYDLASVTKIAATTLAAMKMYDAGRLRLDDKLGKFFKDKTIDYSNIKPDTIFNIDTLYYKDITDIGKILKYQDTLRLNDSMFVAYDTLLIATTPKSNIFNVTIRELLLHKSGITPTLPILPYVLYKKIFYDSIDIIKNRFNEDSLNKQSNFDAKSSLKNIFDEYFTRRYIKDSATVKIAENFYLQNRYFDTLWRDTKRLRVYSRKIYQYSDINMILLQQAIDSINRLSINAYLRSNFYSPMGLKTMTYNPLKYFNTQRIVPTENDRYWREQLLRGNVHDPSAAMLGGISGNAGLFSNAYDLAIVGQMWLNGGTYGGYRYISEGTVRRFTARQEDSHRGLGFDKPSRKSIIGKGASADSYGHTGFTGTCIWVDPVHQLVFVFLSNRVHPDPKNGRINSMQIRQKIHSIVYEAIIK
jgi:CubicO group peptidase (beta-lactamase class C family)